MKVVCFGDYLIHFSPIGDERFEQAELMQMSFTGAEANVSACLGLWGENTEFVTRLPDHSLAQKGIRFLKSFGIETANIPLVQGQRMGVYYLENGRSLRASKVIYDRADSAFTTSRFSDYNWGDIFCDASILYISGITPSLSEELAKCTLEATKEAHKRGMQVFFDINFRPTLCSVESSAKVIGRLLPYITHLIGNEEHIKMIFGISSECGEEDKEARLGEITRKTKKLTGIRNVAVTVRRTLSSDETIVYAAYDKNGEFAVSPQRKINVVDRVGSGDAFSAGLVYATVHGYTTEECVNFASASSALKHTVTKDINFSSVEEIKSLMTRKQCDVIR